MRIKKYIWLPAVISVYFIAMSAIFGVELIKTGHTTKFWLTAGAEIIIIIAMIIFLKKRDEITDRNN